MANSANIAALKAHLVSIDLRVNEGQSLDMWAADIAYQLTELGCLVPAALTDEEAMLAGTRGITEGEPNDDPDQVRDCLERIARGEDFERCSHGIPLSDPCPACHTDPFNQALRGEHP